MRFAIPLGAMTAVALMGTPLTAQQHDHGMRQDSAAAAGQQGCPMGDMHMGMMGAKDSAHMQGMSGMMGMMGQDSAMMATMRFSPKHVLEHGEVLGLTSDQVRKIEALVPSSGGMPDKMPMTGMSKDTMPMRMDSMHMNKMHETAAKVRDVLTPEQRTRATKLPAPCGMMDGGMGMPHPMGADSAKGAGHDEHHR